MKICTGEDVEKMTLPYIASRRVNLQIYIKQAGVSTNTQTTNYICKNIVVAELFVKIKEKKLPKLPLT